jgi:hypothetical protein
MNPELQQRIQNLMGDNSRQIWLRQKCPLNQISGNTLPCLFCQNQITTDWLRVKITSQLEVKCFALGA